MIVDIADHLLLEAPHGGHGDATGVDAWRYALIADRLNELCTSFAELHGITCEAAALCDVPLASAGQALREFHLVEAETLACCAEMSLIASRRHAAEAAP